MRAGAQAARVYAPGTTTGTAGFTFIGPISDYTNREVAFFTQRSRCFEEGTEKEKVIRDLYRICEQFKNEGRRERGRRLLMAQPRSDPVEMEGYS